MYAIMKTGGKQYKVKAGDTVTVERMPGVAVGQTVEIVEVLAIGEGADLQMGTPYVAGAKIGLKLLAETRGPKIIIFKKKRRHNYRRKNGHRQDLAKFEITGITKA
jgi:large subunit ribosomal protein L21